MFRLRLSLFALLLPWAFLSQLGAAKSDGPLSHADALKTIRTLDGFRVELVAAEPMVMDPVAVCWDEDGRMYVVEMGDYPNGPPDGKIKLLEDADGDGKMDRVTLFADKLNFPTGAFPWRGGLLVTAAPDILWLKDTDADGKADIRKVLFTGFGEGNQQHRVNGLIWGLDNWIYGANGDSGGIIRSSPLPFGGRGQGEGGTGRPPVSINGRDFRIRPDEGLIEPVSGHSQFGISFDDWGRRFMCDNRCHIRLEMLPERYLKRNPFLAVRAVTENIAEYGAVGARVYPISTPQERFNDFDNLNHFTSACGIHVYRGGLLPGCDGNAFVCEPVHNLVHRCKLVENGPGLIAKRTEEKREFLASTDPWFRPVYLNTGPDGALYVVDFYRHVIEHPKWIPLDSQKRLDLRAGADKGRIYRIVPDGARSDRVHAVKLSKASAGDLVKHLAHPNAWWRETAQRLLFERQERSEVAALRRMATTHKSPQARIHALWMLEGLGALEQAQVLANLEPFDRDERVGVQALRLAEQWADDEDFTWKTLSEAFIRRAGGPALRLQLVFHLGEIANKRLAINRLIGLSLRNCQDAWFRTAILSSLGSSAPEFGQTLCKLTWSQDNLTADFLVFFREFAAVLGARGQPKEIEEFLNALAVNSKDPRWHYAVISGLTEGNLRGKSPLQSVLGTSPAWQAIRPHFERVLKDAAQIAVKTDQPTASRVEAVALLSLHELSKAGPILTALLDGREPREVQLAAVQALGRQRDPESAALLLKGWRSHTPAVRREILEAVFRQRDRLPKLLDALANGHVLPADLDPQRQQQLLRLLEGEMQAKAKALLGQSRNADRAKVISAHHDVFKLPRDVERGRQVFQKHCAACHRLDGHGTAVGPDLADVRGRPEESLLEDFLDPNRALSPGYVSYVVETTGGQLFTGVLATETANSVTLRRAEGIEDVVLRKDIAGLQSTGQSLMPENLEISLSKQDFADLLAYLKTGSANK